MMLKKLLNKLYCISDSNYGESESEWGDGCRSGRYKPYYTPQEPLYIDLNPEKFRETFFELTEVGS